MDMKQITSKVVLTIVLALYVPPFSSSAADVEKVEPALQSVLASVGEDEKIPIIVRVNDTISVQSLAVQARKKGHLRAQGRANLVHALKSRAQQSKRPLQRLLNTRGIAKQKDLWLINGMAFQAAPAEFWDKSSSYEYLC